MTEARFSYSVGFNPWPALPTIPAGEARVGAGSITVVVSDTITGERTVVDRWFDEAGTRSLRYWPDQRDRSLPWLMWRPLDHGAIAVSAGVDRDEGDLLLAEGEVDADGVLTWDRTPEQSVSGAVVRGLVEGVAQAMTCRVETEEEGLLIGMATRPSVARFGDDLDIESSLRSAHLVTAGRVLRALEAEPVRDPETDEVRARRAIVSDGAAPLQSLGTLVWAEGLRWWPSGRSPWIDAPATGDNVPIEVQTLARALREATPPPAPPHDHP
ncbi:hypothetical protein [Microbacterium sp. TNHR37B]|uniref:hypothetical protein n=1 Tax=Microbacterium sp. TNHR37B TaxID=1775956 RepID=UPI0007B2D8F6|nr:hypothetical protein [Microbacterium sp. TNHR37B]KZE88552.1 hypothetical protein AVP41_03058 [Microbacterium sp. TNHR37B]